MRDRWSIASFGAGLLAFCGIGLLSGHYLTAVAVLVVLALGGSLVALAARATRHARLVRGLHALSVPSRLAGIDVRSAPLRDAAFVAGLSRPTIFCDCHLPERLTEGQLRAVVLHERGHQRAWDPARLLLLELAAPIVRRLPWGRQWLTVALARREIAADQHAIANGARRADLAGALLRLPPLAQAHVAGFASAVDLRLRALLGEELAPALPPRVRRGALLALGGLVGATLCTLLLHQLLAATVGVVCC